MRSKNYILLSALFLILSLTVLLLPSGNKTTPVWAEYKRKIILDAGHGGIDGGAVGYAGSVEKNINLDIALKCELLMGLCGIDTVMTRHEDTTLDDGSGATIARRKADDIKARVSLANSGADAFISIHMNSFPSSKYWGTQTFYSKNNEKSAVLAQCLQDTARTALAAENKREIKKAEDSIYLLKHITIPAVIIECGFISNPDEEARLITDDYQKAVAMSICAGTINFLYNTVSN